MPMPRGPRREFVPKKELDQLAVVNKAMMEAYYQEALHIFRADVLGKVATKELDPTEGNVWHIYRLDNELDSDEPVRDIVLFASSTIRRRSKVQLQVPHIKLVASERFECDDGIEYITTEVTVDDEGDAQYMFGSYPMRKSVLTQPLIPIIFYDEEDGILPENMDSFTNICGLTTDEYPEEVLPFGHFSYFADKLHALNVAADLFAQVKGLHPFAKGYFDD